jgi:hypothetical protein
MMKDSPSNSDNTLYMVMKMYANHVSDANIASDVKDNYTQILSERPNDLLIRKNITAADIRLKTKIETSTQLKIHIETKYPEANFSLSKTMEEQLFSAKKSAMIASSVSKLRSVIRDLIRTDIMKTEYKLSYDFQQAPQTEIKLKNIESTITPKLKQSMQDAITNIRGAGLSKFEASKRANEIVSNVYIELMKYAVILHKKAMNGDDPKIISEAAEKIGYIGESALNKRLNPITIRLEASKQLESEKIINQKRLLQQASELVNKPLNQDFSNELVKLKKALGQQNMSLSEAVSKLPEVDQANFRQATQKMQYFNESTFVR